VPLIPIDQLSSEARPFTPGGSRSRLCGPRSAPRLVAAVLLLDVLLDGS
jgi:hypothetical protein